MAITLDKATYAVGNTDTHTISGPITHTTAHTVTIKIQTAYGMGTGTDHTAHTAGITTTLPKTNCDLYRM